MLAAVKSEETAGGLVPHEPVLRIGCEYKSVQKNRPRPIWPVDDFQAGLADKLLTIVDRAVVCGAEDRLWDGTAGRLVEPGQ